MSEQDVHVVVCDDEADIREMICEYLERRGHRTSQAADAAALEALLAREGASIDVVLLDIAMPGEDGLTVLRRIGLDRAFSVIMVTAAGDTIDRIVGLEMGADDYVAKPVDLRELEARVKAMTRRSARLAGQPAPPALEGPEGRIIVFPGHELDLDRAALYRVAPGQEREETPLTAMEFSLLKVFAENRGRVLNRDQLLELAHDRGWDPFDRSIDIRISRLRRKIERNPTKPEIIRTVRGIGYVFDPE